MPSARYISEIVTMPPIPPLIGTSRRKWAKRSMIVRTMHEMTK